MTPFRLIVFTLALALAAATQALAQLETPAPTPQSVPSGTPQAVPGPTQTPGPTVPTPVPTATPTPSPYKYVVDPTPNPSAEPGAPQILKIELNDQTLHPGGTVAIRVTTTVNVKSVVASAEGHDITIQKAQDGLFAGLTTLPWFIPPWMLKTYQVTFTATAPDGRRVAITIPISLAR
ncbi:MAG: hypothetical protein JO359_06660 [Candidatus Eremiobacteraeota bacterium]|nr:hypothetical protein [Candidatus Eremiobacteraeota bacterium]